MATESSVGIIADQLRFKANLGVPAKTWARLTSRERLSTYAEAMGVGTTVSTVASAAGIASTATSGAAVTTTASAAVTTAALTGPIGWAAAAGLAAGALYFRTASRLKTAPAPAGAMIIPESIQTPIELLAASLLALKLPIAIKFSQYGGSEATQREITQYYTRRWGYSLSFVDASYSNSIEIAETRTYEELVLALHQFLAGNDDCDEERLANDLLGLLRELEMLTPDDTSRSSLLARLASNFEDKRQPIGLKAKLNETASRVVGYANAGTAKLDDVNRRLRARLKDLK